MSCVAPGHQTLSSGKSWNYLHISRLPLASCQATVELKMGKFSLAHDKYVLGEGKEGCVCISVVMPTGLHGAEGAESSKVLKITAKLRLHAVPAPRERMDVGVECQLERADMTAERDRRKCRFVEVDLLA